MNQYIRNFSTITLDDIAVVGGKNASLGQMLNTLTHAGIRVPNGFAVTSQAYWYYLEHNNLVDPIKKELERLQPDDTTTMKVSAAIRALIEQGTIPDDLAQAITSAYQELCAGEKRANLAVAVRSSATAEDLPTASFAGQQESFLNIKGPEDLLRIYVRCVSSLFTPRAIVYRHEQQIDHMHVALSVGVQQMVDASSGSAGVAFTLDTETGFNNVVLINAAWGLGESVVQGTVIPDSVYVYKPTLKTGFKPILSKRTGSKLTKIICDSTQTRTVAVPAEQQQQFCLSNEQILELARLCLIIEDAYSARAGHPCPMDIEWAIDSSNQLYIVQARPETVHTRAADRGQVVRNYLLNTQPPAPLVTGNSIGQKIVTGRVRIIENISDSNQIQNGDILVTRMTDPDWVPAMRRAAGIITDEGGRTCHAAIVSRELGIPALVGTHDATKVLTEQQEITLDCSRGILGFVYPGSLGFTITETILTDLKPAPVTVLLNLGDPDTAFKHSFLPVHGVGLARIEFIIANAIGIHPMALVHPERVTDPVVKQAIAQRTQQYANPAEFFVNTLAQEVGTIAAAFYPKPVTVRFSDFKSNEYRNLLGGHYFEPVEENPMIGLRGASRYYSPLYKEAFALECAALKKVREEMGLTNVEVMIPFVRSVNELKKVRATMKEHNFDPGDDIINFKIIAMIEVPCAVMVMEEMANWVEGFSIGSNDLTQLALGIDRDSALLAPLFDEEDSGVKELIMQAISWAQHMSTPIGICGQGPSDSESFATFLINAQIDSISLNPDAVIPFIQREGF